MKEFPLTLPQRDIYFDQLTVPGAPVYNIGARIIIEGELDPDIMEQAYRVLIDQHDTFHAQFIVKDGMRFMRVLDEYSYNWQYYNCFSEADPKLSADTFCSTDFSKPFDLNSNGPLHFFCLIRIAPAIHWLYSRYHHLITDGWGASLLFKRLMGFYNSLKEFGEITEHYDFSYSELVQNEAEYVKKDFSTDIEYWKERLGGRQGFHLPSKKKNTLAGGREVLYLQRSRYNQIAALCHANKVTVFHFWTTVLALYFCRTYGLDDITIGLPILNRGSAKFKQTVGTFMMINPFLAKVHLSASFKDLMTSIKNELKQDYKHQRLPLRDIAAAIHQTAQRDGKLYQVFFSYEKHDYSASMAGCKTSVVPMTHNMERTPLAVYVREFDETEDVKIDFDYNCNYFDTATCRRLIGHLNVLIDAVLATPDLLCSKLPFLTAGEEARILDLTEQAPRMPVPEGNFLTCLRRRAALAPQTIGVVFGKETLSYQQVLERSGAIAAFLKTKGAGEGTIVALLKDRSANMLLLMLGILQTGAAHLCIDPEFPPARIGYILEDSGARLLVTQKKFRHLLPAAGEGPAVIYWEDYPMNPGTGSAYDYPETVEAPAYMLYTSGSTGTPKGVVVSNKALNNFLYGMQELLGMTPGNSLLAITTYSFDISLLELYLPLVAGATVIIAGKQEQQDPFKMKALIAKTVPDFIQGTPAFWSLLIDAGWKGQTGLKALCGGESLSRSLAEQLLARTGILWNVYGPTEATIWSTIQRITNPDEYRLIGRPIPNTSVYILDKALKLLPEEIDGEIYLGGEGLAIGYHNRPQLTAERFISHPYKADGNRLYKTGDMGRSIAGGAVIYSGRLDHQVKIRGYRIELAEIENVLLAHPAVTAVAVLVSDDQEYDKQLIAFIAPAIAEGATELRAYAAIMLPKYMVPDHWRFLDAMPLTPNGKIDRKKLETTAPAPIETAAEAGQNFSALEITLMDIWKEVLQCTEVGLNDDFFELGGNSFKIVGLITAIEKRLLLNCSFTEVFSHAAFKDFTLLIADKVKGSSKPPLASPAAGPYPLTGFQQYILRVSGRREGSLTYTLFDAWFFQGAADAGLLKKTCYLLLLRHEMLRTVIDRKGETSFLQILDPDRYPATFRQHHAMDLDNITRAITAINSKPLSLEKGSLWEVVLFPVSTGGNVLFARMHHLICDGASLDVFVREFFECYRCLAANKEWLPPALTFQFKEYAAAQEQLQHSGAYKASASYWQNIFTDRPACTFLPGRVLNTKWLTSSFKGRTLQLEVDRSLKNKIEKQARECRTSSFIVVLTAFFRLLHEETSNSDITICIPVSGRESTGMEDQIGVFTNTIPLRVEVLPADTTDMLILKVKEAFLLGYEHHQYQLHQLAGQIEEMHGIVSDHLFNMMLNYQYRKHSVADELMGSGSEIRRVDLPREWSNLDLSMNFFETPTSLSVEMEYRPDLCTDEQGRQLLNKFISLLTYEFAE